MFQLIISLQQLEYTFPLLLPKWWTRYQGGLGASAHNKSSSAQLHLYYSLSDKYIIKVAEVFQLIISLHQLEYTFIIA